MPIDHSIKGIGFWLREISRFTFSSITFRENNKLHNQNSFLPFYLVHNKRKKLIISLINNLIVCKHNQVAIGGQNNRQNQILWLLIYYVCRLSLNHAIPYSDNQNIFGNMLLWLRCITVKTYAPAVNWTLNLIIMKDCVRYCIPTVTNVGTMNTKWSSHGKPKDYKFSGFFPCMKLRFKILSKLRTHNWFPPFNKLLLEQCIDGFLEHQHAA